MDQEKRKPEKTLSAVLCAVKTAVAEWSNTDTQIRVMADSESAYWAVADFDYCMGEIVVDQPVWAPYRFVKMEILPLDEELPVFVWYDSADDDAAAVRQQITEGLNAAMQCETTHGRFVK